MPGGGKDRGTCSQRGVIINPQESCPVSPRGVSLSAVAKHVRTPTQVLQPFGRVSSVCFVVQ